MPPEPRRPASSPARPRPAPPPWASPCARPPAPPHLGVARPSPAAAPLSLPSPLQEEHEAEIRSTTRAASGATPLSAAAPLSLPSAGEWRGGMVGWVAVVGPAVVPVSLPPLFAGSGHGFARLDLALAGSSVLPTAVQDLVLPRFQHSQLSSLPSRFLCASLPLSSQCGCRSPQSRRGGHLAQLASRRTSGRRARRVVTAW